MTNTGTERDKFTEEIFFGANNWSARDIAFFNQIKLPHETSESLDERTAHYLQKFKLYEQGKRYLGWHWSAFLWGSYWGNYRRLYSLFFIEIFTDIIRTLVLINYQNIPENGLTNNPIIILRTITFIFIGYRILLGYYANLIYIRKIINKIEKGSASYKPSTWLLWITILVVWLVKIVNRYL